MCLITTKPDPKILEEDLVVYKMLLVSWAGELVSPYYVEFKWELDKLYNAEGNIWNTVTTRWDPGTQSTSFCINGGAFHAFPDIAIAADWADRLWCHAWFIENINRRYAIVKCIIPKGTQVWEGTHDCPPYYPCVATKSIKIVEVEKIISDLFR